MKFADLGLSPETLRAIEEVGYETPTPIQEKAIPCVLMGRDVLGIAQTGTGKTAGFTLPMIEILANGRAKARMPRSLILAPTRELATQVSENFTTYGKYHKLDMALLIGGESMGDQMRALDKGVDVLIATPGRLLDLFERGKVLLRDVKVLVIDEADRMLDMGFIPDVERIVSLLPPLRQTLFFSATMDKVIRKLADAFLTNPREVSIERKATAAETVTQRLAMVPRIDKREALRHILRSENVRNAFIFCNRKRDVDVLNRSLRKHGFNSISLHGDMDQPTRNDMLRRFKDGQADLLVCSDVAARGLDIDDVSHVINFDIPTHSEDYVHRIGRTGRAGKDGAAFSLATPDDAKYVAGIESLLGRAIPRMVLEGLDSTDAEDRGAGEAAAAAGGAAAGGRGGRRRRTGRGRGADSGASRADKAPVDLVEPVVPAEPAADAGRAADGDGDAGLAAGGPPRARRPTRGRRDQQERDGIRSMSHADDVAAFGDHTPAFFLRDDLVPMGRTLPGDPDEGEGEGEGEAQAQAGSDAGEPTAGRTTRRGRGTRAKSQAGATRGGERKRHGRRAAPVEAAEAAAPDAGADETGAPQVDPVTDAAETPAEPQVAAADAEPPAPTPTRRRRATRRKTTADAANAESAVTDAATGAEASASPDSDGVEDASGAMPDRKPARRRARRRAPADESDESSLADTPAGTDTGADGAGASDPDASNGAAAPEAPAKRPRRARAPRKAKADSQADATATDKETDPATATEDTEAPPAKPKRAPRRRKTASAGSADDGATPAESAEAPATPDAAPEQDETTGA